MPTWDAEPGVVRLPDGRTVRGTGRRVARDDASPPDHAVYLLARDPQETGWPNRCVRWRDFSLPASTEDALDALRDAHARAADERVEIACHGGTGRTGTALAVLAVMSGVPAEDAVGWVRSAYRPRAVETRRQREWIRAVAARLT
ncbi:protein-tyrosine phosphatase family protein [Georgenia sp. Z1491]|uniref:protein-tyrosine phosphatase family protein n=1 Tax=Georgenia sp. Z1491 TaxID=3416707 RepID=UPI003CEB6DF5